MQRDDYEGALQKLQEAAGMMPQEAEAYLAEMSVMNDHLDYEYTLDLAVNTVLQQIKDIPESFLAIDEEEVGRGNKIPLWMFGLLY